MKIEHYLLQADDEKTMELRASILTFFISTCIYIVISKTTGFLISYLEDFATRTFGYSSCNFYIFTLTFYILMGIFSYYYFDRINRAIFTDGIFQKFCCQQNSCPFATAKCAFYTNLVECLNDEKRNLFHENHFSCNFEAIMNVFSEPDWYSTSY